MSPLALEAAARAFYNRWTTRQIIYHSPTSTRAWEDLW